MPLKSGFAIAALVLALAGTIVLYVMVFPKSKEQTLNKFFKFVRDFFDLKYLIIEKVLKFLYVFESLLIILVGFFMLFNSATILMAPFVMVLGPIMFRLLYELFMMIILLIKNVMEINGKLKGDSGSATSRFDAIPDIPRPAQRTAPPQQAPAQPIATPIPSPIPNPIPNPTPAAQRVCPSCGTPLNANAAFCPNCGQPIQ